MTSLTDRLDNFPEPWKPSQPGDKLVGTVVDVDIRESEYGEPYKIVTVLDEDGKEWAWHAYHTMARSEVEKRDPRVGDQIGVAYHGQGEAAPGMNAPERWRVLTEKPESKPADEEDDAIPF